MASLTDLETTKRDWQEYVKDCFNNETRATPALFLRAKRLDYHCCQYLLQRLRKDCGEEEDKDDDDGDSNEERNNIVKKEEQQPSSFSSSLFHWLGGGRSWLGITAKASKRRSNHHNNQQKIPRPKRLVFARCQIDLCEQQEQQQQQQEQQETAPVFRQLCQQLASSPLEVLSIECRGQEDMVAHRIFYLTPLRLVTRQEQRQPGDSTGAGFTADAATTTTTTTSSSVWIHLKELSLTGLCFRGQVGAAHLYNIVAPRAVLYHNHFLPNLERLRLVAVKMDYDSMRELAHGLRDRSTLRHLYLHRCDICDAMLQILADQALDPKKQPRHQSAIDKNDVESSLQTLQTLSLVGNSLTPLSIPTLTGILKQKPQLKELDLSGNDRLWRANVARQFATEDEALELRRQRKHFCDTLASHPSLTKLSLLHVGMTEPGANALLQALAQRHGQGGTETTVVTCLPGPRPHSRLQSLFLTGNLFERETDNQEEQDDTGTAVIRHLPHIQGLRHLALPNTLSQHVLTQALEANNSLISLTCRSIKGCARIHQLLARNRIWMHVQWMNHGMGRDGGVGENNNTPENNTTSSTIPLACWPRLIYSFYQHTRDGGNTTIFAGRWSSSSSCSYGSTARFDFVQATYIGWTNA